MNQVLNQRYQILQKLGEGGFGTTYLAEDIQMPSHRLCVIKQLKPIHQDPQTFMVVKERFKKEAAILEKLGQNHPQIPQLYAYFELQGQFYLVQEYVEGETLEEKIKAGGPLKENTVKDILLGLLTILDFLHSHRIIHRDIKPENIILKKADNSPFLIDFGAVKEAMQTQMATGAPPTSSIIIGTPGYMPPEQSTGRPVYATDIYALGLTAIYALTGKTPQELTTDPQTGEIEWEPLASALGGISSSLSSVLERAIRFHPQERFPSAVSMAEALNGNGSATSSPTLVVAPASPTTPRTATPRRRGNCLLKLLGLILFTVLGSAALLYWWLFSKKIESSLPRREVEKNPYSTVDFPQNSCGEALPNDSNSYPLAIYPVFTKFNEATLGKIKTEFCRDAFVNIDRDNNSKIIQIASFVNLKQAQQFSEFMQSRLDHSEVGNPQIISVNPQQENKEDKPETIQNRLEVAENYFNSLDFPQNSCGQALPKNSNAYPLRVYPVYVDFNSATLSGIKVKLCRDAFVKTRKDTNTKVIQIASFLDPDKAQQFSEFIEMRIGKAEVGTPRTLQANPSSENKDDDEVDTLGLENSVAVIEKLYKFISNKNYARANKLFVDDLHDSIDPKFFNQFQRVTVENLQVVSRDNYTINLVGENTYVYKDGSRQRELRSYAVTQVAGKPKISSSKFIKVLKFR